MDYNESGSETVLLLSEAPSVNTSAGDIAVWSLNAEDKDPLVKVACRDGVLDISRSTLERFCLFREALLDKKFEHKSEVLPLHQYPKKSLSKLALLLFSVPGLAEKLNPSNSRELVEEVSRLCKEDSHQDLSDMIELAFYAGGDLPLTNLVHIFGMINYIRGGWPLSPRTLYQQISQVCLVCMIILLAMSFPLIIGTAIQFGVLSEEFKNMSLSVLLCWIHGLPHPYAVDVRFILTFVNIAVQVRNPISVPWIHSLLWSVWGMAVFQFLFLKCCLNFRPEPPVFNGNLDLMNEFKLNPGHLDDLSSVDFLDCNPRAVEPFHLEKKKFRIHVFVRFPLLSLLLPCCLLDTLHVADDFSPPIKPPPAPDPPRSYNYDRWDRPGCVSANTKVLRQDSESGQMRATTIDALQLGDRICGPHGNLQTVTWIRCAGYERILRLHVQAQERRITLDCSMKHPLICYDHKEREEASSANIVKCGVQVMDCNDHSQLIRGEIIKKEILPDRFPIFALTVVPDHLYFSNEIVSENKA